MSNSVRHQEHRHLRAEQKLHENRMKRNAHRTKVFRTGPLIPIEAIKNRKKNWLGKMEQIIRGNNASKD